MGTPQTTAVTHDVELAEDVVRKRFRDVRRGEAEREWLALRLLAEHAPGLAPAPIRAELSATPPSIVMSRLPGVPLGIRPLTAVELDGYTAAIDRVHHALPRPVLERIGTVYFWPPANGLDQVRTMAAGARPQPDADEQVRRAFDETTGWLASGGIERAAAEDGTAVFGHGDGNPVNYLWDGRTARPVDFENSGRSDRAFELADIVEHLGLWRDAQVEPDAFLDCFDLSPRERARVHGFRRLFAVYWFVRLQPGRSAHRRNPPGTLERQAERLLRLFGSAP